MEFNLSSILPDPRSLMHGISSESISAGFCVILLLIFIFFLGKLFLEWYRAGKRMRFFRFLLKDTKQEQLVAERRSLREKAKKEAKTKAKKHNGCGEIWQEFDESLVISSDGKHLHNTLDADHFFNSHTLARGVTESRLLAAVPGFLTAVGVIGTFFGLQLGLGALELNTGDTEQLKSGISTLISSASIAFMTSVWGVFLSLMFNVVEKAIEGKLRSDIARLQTRIDELFSRITAERTLLDIEHHSKVSRDTLNGLAEQIGERMQVVMQGMAETVATGMEQSLAKVMEPAIAKLVSASDDLANKQGKSSEGALKKLLEDFSDQLGKAGSEQGNALSKVSEGINSSITQWGDTMTRFMAQLNMTITRLEEMGKEQQQAISLTIGQSIADQQNLSRENANQTRQVIGGLVNGLREEREKENEENQQRREQRAQDEADRQQVLMDQLSSFMEKQNDGINDAVNKTTRMTGDMIEQLNERIKELADQDNKRSAHFKEQSDSQNQATREILEEARALNLSVQQVQKGLDNASDNLLRTGTQLNVAAASLQQGYEQVAQSNDSLAGNIAMATHANTETVKQVDQITENLHRMLKTFEELQKALETVSQQISSGAEISTRSAQDLTHHHQQYRQEMTETIERLHKQLSELLGDYGRKVSDQTTDRMREWNQHTREYTNAMGGVVSVMRDMLEDMESRETAWQ